jgi:hypothetical protein
LTRRCHLSSSSTVGAPVQSECFFVKILSQSRSSYSTAWKSGARERVQSGEIPYDRGNRLTPDAELRSAGSIGLFVIESAHDHQCPHDEHEHGDEQDRQVDPCGTHLWFSGPRVMIIFAHQFCLFRLCRRFSGLEECPTLLFLMFEHFRMMTTM